ncbi:hypothetical protein Pcinc_037657 [Petrolisthes cinctipes]|uniref:Uncharacterized protein n=1 Tax=Petrolisthes cinctipes TaxID=88211 RepID=A0AAE1ELB3_PETCI|nr:hypothetical protein Pcinc_037657 [Petrolisthes cinctipes]
MIIEKSRPPSNDTESDGTHTPPSPRHSPPTPNQVTQTLLSDTTQQVNLVRDRVDMLDIDRKIEIIMSKLETKDSEIDLLSTEIKTAYNTIEQLQNRIVELEQHRCGSEAHQHALGTRSTPLNNCLLLGDTNLRTIRRSDLQNEYQIRTIFEANMDLLRCWINEKLSHIPSECILYNGITDILEEKSPTTILNNLGLLIADLKETNSDMKVRVCQIVPPPSPQEIQAKIHDYNEQLIKWGEANGIDVIKTVPSFTMSTGEIDDLCFETKISPYPTLNRLGAVKLLNTIKKQCPDFHLCSNWEEIKKNINTQTPQRSENRYMGYNNVRPVNREPVQSAGSRGQTSYADIASLRAHGRTTQQHPAHKASHHPPTAPKPRSPSHLTPARTMTRERETGWNNKEGAFRPDLHNAALRRRPEDRHYTAYNQAHASGVSRWNRSNLGQKHTSLSP